MKSFYNVILYFCLNINDDQIYSYMIMDHNPMKFEFYHCKNEINSNIIKVVISIISFNQNLMEVLKSSTLNLEENDTFRCFQDENNTKFLINHNELIIEYYQEILVLAFLKNDFYFSGFDFDLKVDQSVHLKKICLNQLTQEESNFLIFLNKIEDNLKSKIDCFMNFQLNFLDLISSTCEILNELLIKVSGYSFEPEKSYFISEEVKYSPFSNENSENSSLNNQKHRYSYNHLFNQSNFVCYIMKVIDIFNYDLKFGLGIDHEKINTIFKFLHYYIDQNESNILQLFSEKYLKILCKFSRKFEQKAVSLLLSSLINLKSKQIKLVSMQKFTQTLSSIVDYIMVVNY